MDDYELIQMLKQRPEEGMAYLTKRYAGLLWTVARGRLHPNYFDAADVEDCVSEVLGQFYLDLDRFDPARSTIATYLSLMVRRRCVDLLRKANRAGIPVSLDEEEAMELPSDAPSPEELTEKKDEERRAMALVRSLGEPDRSILLGKYYFGYPTKALAKALGMTPSAIDTRAHRLLKKLKKQLEGEMS